MLFPSQWAILRLYWETLGNLWLKKPRAHWDKQNLLCSFLNHFHELFYISKIEITPLPSLNAANGEYNLEITKSYLRDSGCVIIILYLFSTANSHGGWSSFPCCHVKMARIIFCRALLHSGKQWFQLECSRPHHSTLALVLMKTNMDSLPSKYGDFVADYLSEHQPYDCFIDL